MTILIGTTSWTEKTLIESGRFYPPSARTAEARLRYYAERFPVVEVDSSYYGMPSEQNARLWVDRTPPGFVFDVKAFRVFTGHPASADALPADLRAALPPTLGRTFHQRDLPKEITAELWARFRSALEPLRAAGKLGALLFQFPPRFGHSAENLDHLRACRRRLPDLTLAIEFRHGSWLNARRRDEVLAFERDLQLVNVVVDEPQGVAGSVPPVWAVTLPALAVVRLHGRNAATWNRKGLPSAAERFEYRYSDEELAEFREPVRRLAEQADAVHVLFNNCHQDKAQVNAATFRRLLE